jgi:hypothetical protein
LTLRRAAALTPSAVSQRIKALEQRVGQVLVVREKPCTATAAGIPLLRLAAQTALLEAEALAEMGGGDGAAARIALAVNADSMATWFTGAFRGLLSNGADPVPGCSRSASSPHWLRRASPLHDPVDRRAGNGEQLSELGAGVLSRVPQLDEVRLLRGFELGLLAEQSALGLGDLHALPRPYPDQARLKLSDHRKDVEQ